MEMLCVTGGVPCYLEEVKSTLSADENIKRLAFIKNGILYRKFNDIFHDLFTTESQYYRKLVTVLVDGSLEYSETCARLKVEKVACGAII